MNLDEHNTLALKMLTETPQARTLREEQERRERNKSDLEAQEKDMEENGSDLFDSFERHNKWREEQGLKPAGCE